MNLRPLHNDALDIKACGNTGHWGLWFERFFTGYPADYDTKTHKDKWAQAKTNWIKDFHNRKCGDKESCETACARQREFCKVLNNDADGERLADYIRVLNVDWHFVTGMGLPHPIENGFLWHPTLGTPYLPGSSIKGLLRSWVEAWDDDSDKEAKLLRWFGSESKAAENSDKDNQTGNLIFFDAIPSQPPTLKVDIMTPHMDEWYEKGGKGTNDAKELAKRTPADWHDPNPIQFLVADQPVFQFAIAQRPDSLCHVEISEVMDALQEALEWLGAGAKTAVGYGQFIYDKEKQPMDSSLHPWLVEQIKVLKEQHGVEKAWVCQQLANAWNGLKIEDDREVILEQIEVQWEKQELGSWDKKAPKGTQRKAHKIYRPELYQE